MTDIATQILLDIERRLTSMEHRLGALEAKSAPKSARQPIDLAGILSHPRLWWGLIVAGLATAGIVPPETANKIVLSLF